MEDPRHGENTEIRHIKFSFGTGSMLLFIVTYDDMLIRCLLFPPQPTNSGSKLKYQPPQSGSTQLLGTGRPSRKEETSPSSPDASVRPTAEHNADFKPWEPAEEVTAFLISV